MENNSSRRRSSKPQQKQPTALNDTNKYLQMKQTKPAANDSNHLPAHLIAPEARNFAHHKRVGDYAKDTLLRTSWTTKSRDFRF